MEASKAITQIRQSKTDSLEDECTYPGELCWGQFNTRIEGQEATLCPFNRREVSLHPQSVSGRTALHPSALFRTHESLVGDCGSCSVEPRLLVQVARRDKRRGRHLLRVKPESCTSRIVLPLRNRPRDCFGLEMIVEAGEILIRVILPHRKRRNCAIFLSLGPVKDVLVLVWTGKRRHGRGEGVNCDAK